MSILRKPKHCKNLEVLVPFLQNQLDLPTERVFIIGLNDWFKCKGDDAELMGYEVMLIEDVTTCSNEDTANFSIRSIFKYLLKKDCPYFIMVHNHPAQSVIFPSDIDLKITREMVRIAEELECTMLDHWIVTKDSYFSFRKKGLMEKSASKRKVALEHAKNEHSYDLACYVYEKVKREQSCG